jgi:hypothetical protein
MVKVAKQVIGIAQSMVEVAEENVVEVALERGQRVKVAVK